SSPVSKFRSRKGPSYLALSLTGSRGMSCSASTALAPRSCHLPLALASRVP
uniref:Uncharacterized protein n=1 Tax=Cannabis sativa TaxID=3483 RepID=A0A803QS02_CANSA